MGFLASIDSCYRLRRRTVLGHWESALDLAVKKEQTSRSPAELLSQLIVFDSEDRAVWPAKELRGMLRHQMRVHLRGFGGRSEMRTQLIEKIIAEADPPIQTFSDLLRHPKPPLSLLRMITEFAKRARDNPASSLPPEISLLLYHGCITAALVCWDERISTLSDDELRAGMSWGARQPWVDEATRNLFFHGLQYLRSPRRQWRTSRPADL